MAAFQIEVASAPAALAIEEVPTESEIAALETVLPVAAVLVALVEAIREAVLVGVPRVWAHEVAVDSAVVVGALEDLVVALAVVAVEVEAAVDADNNSRNGEQQ